MKNLRRTLKGRVVYNRKKHEFTVKRLGNITSTLYSAEKGNMTEWRYINKISGLAWAYHATKENRKPEILAYFSRFNVCDPIIRTARDLYSFMAWLLGGLDYLIAIPYVGVAAALGATVLNALYDRDVHRKLNFMVSECDRGQE